MVNSKNINPNVFLHNPIYRSHRKLEVLQFVRDATAQNKIVDVEKVKGLFSLKWGLSSKVIEAYINELQSVGAIIREGMNLTFTKFGEEVLSGAV